MKICYILSLFFTIFACGQPSENNSKQEIKQNSNKSNNIVMNASGENSQNNPEAVVKSLITAMSENDAEKIRSSFNENTKQAYGNGDWKSGKDFFGWLESDIIERDGHVDNAQFETDGNSVVVTGQYSSRGYSNKANFLFVVEDDKIKSWQMRY